MPIGGRKLIDGRRWEPSEFVVGLEAPRRHSREEAPDDARGASQSYPLTWIRRHYLGLVQKDRAQISSCQAGTVGIARGLAWFSRLMLPDAERLGHDRPNDAPPRTPSSPSTLRPEQQAVHLSFPRAQMMCSSQLLLYLTLIARRE
jgi:hypothetical protein